ncbi:MAG: insulinase family protein [Alphaproteobacteria bacterium]|nr:insulinase family protein [Alphaproteobacteria bacterium]MBQ6854989.1 insulinase family protein [Alphaproteobacteria bacterium]
MVVQVSVLSNGIRVVTQGVPHTRTSTVGFWIGKGSIGISHIVDHMIFKGT